MPDKFSGVISGLESPPSRGFSVAPSDSTDLAFYSRALWVGVAGNIKVTTAGGDDLVYKNVSGRLSLRVRRVWATGTTATDIIAEY